MKSEESSMQNLFSCIYNPATGITLGTFLICVVVSLVLGAGIALVFGIKNRSSRSFLTTLALLPATVTVVIMLVNGNLGAGVAVAGAFSLVRFRSVPGTAREIGAIFLAMAVGLACGMGYPAFAVVFAAIMCAVLMAYTLSGFGSGRDFHLRKVLRITVPEDLDYAQIFDDIFQQYTVSAVLTAVKTTNLGSLNRLTYEVVLRKAGTEKQLIDALRCRNGNLEISMSIIANEQGEL